MLVKIDTFNGMMPRVEPHLLQPSSAVEALNCKMASGAIRSWKEPLAIGETAAGALSIFLYDSTYWLKWGTVVSAVTSPLASDPYQRLYWTGDGVPKMATFDMITIGSTSYPNASRSLGIDAPATAPTISVPAISAYSDVATYQVGDFFTYDGSTYKCLVMSAPYVIPAYSATATYIVGAVVTDSGNTYKCGLAIEEPEAFTPSHWYLLSDATAILEAVLFYRVTIGDFGELFDTDQETRSYVYRFVSDLGEAGPPSPASAEISIYPGQIPTVNGLTNGYAYGTKELFRTNTGTDTTEFQFVAEVALASTSYVDSIDSASLGEVLNSTLWDAPPDDLAGLIALPNGCLVGYSGNEVCFSVPYMPHAWPVDYRYPVTGTIKGIGAYGLSVVVTTDGAPYVATGQDPASMSLEKLESGYACVSTLGVVDMGYAVAYPSPHGLMVAGVGTAGLVTAKVMGRDEWQDYHPETIQAAFYGGLYLAFTDNGGFIFDQQTNDLINIDLVPTATFHDSETGDLYLVIDDEIVRWDAGTVDLTNRWKSRPFVLNKPGIMTSAQVKADSYPVTFRVYGDGVLLSTKSVRNSKPFRTKCRKLVQEVQMEVSGTTGIWSMSLAESMEEIRRS